MAEPQAEFIIVGGGLTGCALASRLCEKHPSSKILIIEAGSDARSDLRTTTFGQGLTLVGSPSFDWAYSTTSQPNTGNRVHTVNSGKTLGGGSVINYGGWARASAADYDDWAKAVGNDGWSFRGLLPYFKRTENFHGNSDSEYHGFAGPIQVIPGAAERKYGLRDALFNAWLEEGLAYNNDPGNGRSNGISEFLENWRGGARQSAPLAYPLSGASIMTDTIVHRVIFEGRRATGVLLGDGRKITATREIILCAGALRTPQLLMLSGIGPAQMLQKYGIEVLQDVPGVGANLTDHFALYQFFKVQNSELGLSVGSAAFTDNTLTKGFPVDWTVNDAVPLATLSQALQIDEAQGKEQPTAGRSRILADDPSRSHTQTFIVYSTLGIPGIPVDGSIITTSTTLLTPTSRGTISLASTNPSDPPTIDPNFYATAADRAMLIHGVRRLLRALLATPSGQQTIEAEVPPPDFAPLSPDSTDEEIDHRIRATGLQHYHSAGTAAMGTVVDPKLAVYGVEGLRVADASVFPVPIGAPLQATLYALAERAAELVGTV